MNPDFIPLSVPNMKENELKYTTDAIASGWVADGSYIGQFENKLAAYVGAPEAAACQSGTAGLHLALLALGVGAGQEVIVPALTFIAAVNPVRYSAAEPVFMDCDDTLCMDMDKLEEFCRNECDFTGGKLINKHSGRHIAAVIVVHVFGNLANMERLIDIAQSYGLAVVEDATEALGSYFKEGLFAGRFAGTLGDMGVYSFNGNKIITTGGGGMVVGHDKERLARVRHLSTQAKTDTVYFMHDELGYNYRMTNVQAALGIAQMERLEDFIKHKISNYRLYQELGIPLHPFREDIRANHWFYSYLTAYRDELIKYLAENRVQSRPVWHLIHELPFYKDNQSYRIEKAKYYHERIVSIPCSTNLPPEDVRRVASLVSSFEKSR